MSYNAQPKVAVHCSCGAKLFDFGSTNVGIILYLVVLKIAIWLFSTTNNNNALIHINQKTITNIVS